MKIEFRDQRLALIQTDHAAQTGLPIAVIKSCRDKLVILAAAPDERTLWKWRSLRYEKLKGKREGERSIRLNDQWRLIVELRKEVSGSPTIIVVAVEDYH